uniref:Chromatin modification-related protein MEAF6 n=1 Tax=Aceria tosichella TaxID=561515 RepID=A0A6G1S3T0_9ACAR
MPRTKSNSSSTNMPDDTDPRQKLIELVRQRSELTDQLATLERQIYKFEESYLLETAAYGNIVRGWDRYSSHTLHRQTQPKRERKIKDTERLFFQVIHNIPNGNQKFG